MQHIRPIFAPDRYSAKKMAKPVNFVCRAPDAKQVFLTGDFNDWDPVSHPMKRQPDGAWTAQVPLNHGASPLPLPGGRQSRPRPASTGHRPRPPGRQGLAHRRKLTAAKRSVAILSQAA